MSLFTIYIFISVWALLSAIISDILYYIKLNKILMVSFGEKMQKSLIVLALFTCLMAVLIPSITPIYHIYYLYELFQRDISKEVVEDFTKFSEDLLKRIDELDDSTK